MAVAGERVYLHEREPAERSAGHARGLEEAGGLLPYVLQVRLDFDRRAVRAVLFEFPRCESDRSLCEEVVSRGCRDLTPVACYSGRRAAPALGPVHDVVVDQGGSVEDLYGRSRPEQVLPPRLPHACAQYQEQRPEALPA